MSSVPILNSMLWRNKLTKSSDAVNCWKGSWLWCCTFAALFTRTSKSGYLHKECCKAALIQCQHWLSTEHIGCSRFTLGTSDKHEAVSCRAQTSAPTVIEQQWQLVSNAGLFKCCRYIWDSSCLSPLCGHGASHLEGVTSVHALVMCSATGQDVLSRQHSWASPKCTSLCASRLMRPPPVSQPKIAVALK